MQKPFGVNMFVNIVEDKNVYCESQKTERGY
jgi:hypothetical protein